MTTALQAPPVALVLAALVIVLVARPIARQLMRTILARRELAALRRRHVEGGHRVH